MSNSARGLDLSRTDQWENQTTSGSREPSPIQETPTGDASSAQREEDAPSSFFRLRWLGEAD